MQTFLFFFFDTIVVFIKLMQPGGAKSLGAENMALRQQLITINRRRRRAPNLSTPERFILGLLAHCIPERRLNRIAIIVKPKTILNFHRALVQNKYELLFSSRKRKEKPGPKGPDQDVINAVLEMMRKNPMFGCPRIAKTMRNIFGIDLSPEQVGRILKKHYKPGGDDGPSWLTFLGHMKDSLWSIDFFRCESIYLKSHWVMVVMDQFTRRIIGFAVNKGCMNGADVCRMFNDIVSNGNDLPKYISSDNDPLFRFHRWRANLRIREINEIKTVPYVPLSHPFVERLIGTIRRECLDQTLFFNEDDLKEKLDSFKEYYNHHRSHDAHGFITPVQKAEESCRIEADLNNFSWQSHCRGLFHTPIPV